MLGKTGVILLVIVALSVVACLGVYFALSAEGHHVGDEWTESEESESGSNMITISGRVEVKGDLRGGAVKLSATPMPESVGTLRDSWTHLAITPAGRQVPYRFRPLPLESKREVTRTDHGGLRPASKAAAGKAYHIEHYVVKLVPPPGWSVTPDQYEVSATTATADFVLQRR